MCSRRILQLYTKHCFSGVAMWLRHTKPQIVQWYCAARDDTDTSHLHVFIDLHTVAATASLDMSVRHGVRSPGFRHEDFTHHRVPEPPRAVSIFSRAATISGKLGRDAAAGAQQACPTTHSTSAAQAGYSAPQVTWPGYTYVISYHECAGTRRRANVHTPLSIEGEINVQIKCGRNGSRARQE